MTMKRVLSLVLCLALLLPCMVLPGFAETAPVVYLDSVNGSDSNDGLTEATAVATVYGGYAKCTTTSIAGNVNITLGEGAKVDTLYAGSRDSGDIKGIVTLIIDGADITSTAIYGKSKTAGTIGGFELLLKEGSLGTVPTNLQKVTVNTTAGGTVSYPAELGVDEVIGYGVGKVGTTAYAPLQYAADNAADSYVQLMIDCSADVTLTGDLYLDLAGFDLGGSMDLNGFKLYGLDSTTDSYSDAGIGYLAATLTNGIPEIHFKDDGTHLGSILRYVAVPSAQGYSFHRLYLGITHQTLKPASNGVGYKALFAADDTLKAYMDSFGYSLQLDGFSAKTKTMDSSKLVSLDTVTLRIDNFDIQNYGDTNLYAGVCVVLSDGTVIETATIAMTVRELVEAVNTNTSAYTADQLSALKAMLEKYNISEDWDISNITA